MSLTPCFVFICHIEETQDSGNPIVLNRNRGHEETDTGASITECSPPLLCYVFCSGFIRQVQL